MRATYEIRPPVWAETLAVLQSVSLPGGPAAVRAGVVAAEGTRVTVEFPALEHERDAEQLLSACIAGEWADRGDMESCRLLEVEWPGGLPGPAHGAEPGVSVGAIVKPALGLEPAEAAAVAAELAAGGAVFLKDDELMASPPYSPLLSACAACASGSRTACATHRTSADRLRRCAHGPRPPSPPGRAR